MVSYLRKVALSVAVVAVSVSSWFSYTAIRSIWIDTPVPVVAAEVPGTANEQKPSRAK